MSRTQHHHFTKRSFMLYPAALLAIAIGLFLGNLMSPVVLQCSRSDGMCHVIRDGFIYQSEEETFSMDEIKAAYVANTVTTNRRKGISVTTSSMILERTRGVAISVDPIDFFTSEAKVKEAIDEFAAFMDAPQQQDLSIRLGTIITSILFALGVGGLGMWGVFYRYNLRMKLSVTRDWDDTEAETEIEFRIEPTFFYTSWGVSEFKLKGEEDLTTDKLWAARLPKNCPKYFRKTMLEVARAELAELKQYQSDNDITYQQAS